MARPWVTLDRVDSDAGCMELRRRDAGDFLITVGGRVLMNSRQHRSETALAELALGRVGKIPSPVVLIGGLGMGYTLQAALAVLPAAARVIVAETNPTVVEWCRGPLSDLTGNAIDDPRVEVTLHDVRTSFESCTARFSAILLDLYEGPGSGTPNDDPLYGSRALRQMHGALQPGGVLAVWSEQPFPAYERRLRTAGFAVERHRPGRGGLRHAVYVARRVPSR